ncbi:MAG: Cna B-type domain-containing protein, partial [Clostridia bacterium]|nr:Cna B-type domain-containing protein [Clostridia bacterium]
NLAKYDAEGYEYTYSVSESEIEGYTTAQNGYDFTNTITGTTSVSGTKTWVDGNRTHTNKDEIVLTLIRVSAKAGSNPETVSAEVTWNGNTYTFANLAKYDAEGYEYTYSVSESEIEGYTTAQNGYDFTNTITGTTSVSGTKTWVDGNRTHTNKDEIVLTLTRKSAKKNAEVETVTATPTWNGNTYTFANLAKYDAEGYEYTYSVSESEINVPDMEFGDSYIASYSGTNNLDITNKITGTTELKVAKSWDDDNNRDGVRPAEISVQLMQNDESLGEPVVLNSENEWKHTFEKLPKYDEDGVKFVYTVQENLTKTDAENYTPSYSVENGVNVITNTHELETVEIPVEKTWVGDSVYEMPESITYNLYADGEFVASHTVTAEDEWKYTFTQIDENTPLYKYNDGAEIDYRVSESYVPGYTTVVEGDRDNGFTVTNTATSVKFSKRDITTGNELPGAKLALYEIVDDERKLVAEWVSTEETHELRGLKADTAYVIVETEAPDGYVITAEITFRLDKDGSVLETPTTIVENGILIIGNTPKTTTVKVNKIWEDNNDSDGVRPENITVNLLANGVTVNTAVITPDENGDWAYEFTETEDGTPLYIRSDSKEIVYTVTEDAVSVYETEYSDDTFTITNKYNPEITGVTVEKIWDDADNQDGIRPELIEVALLADGEQVDTAELKAENAWKFSFTDLPKFKDHGKEIAYTVEELTETKGYTVSYSDDTFTITNTHEVEKVEVPVSKTWLDEGYEEYRPESITVILYADGKEIDTAELSDENEWHFTFENLDKFAEGKPIEYTVGEIEVEHYVTIVDGYEIMNAIIPPEQYTVITDYEVKKVWDDEGYEDIRPLYIKVQLLRDGEPYGDPVELNADNDWYYKWSLEKFADSENMKDPYEYSVEEIDIPDNYSVSYEEDENGVTITNTYENEKPTPTPEATPTPDVTPTPTPEGTPTPTPTPTVPTPSTPTTPSTGDTSNVGTWMLIMAISVAGMAVLFVVYRRRTKTNR